MTRRTVIIGGIAVVLCVAVYLLAVWTSRGQLDEDSVLRATGDGHDGSAALDLLNVVGAATVLAAVGVVYLVGRLRGSPVLGVAGVAVIVGSVLTAELLQAVLPRPILLQHGYRREDHSFPSGHTAIFVSVLFAALLVLPQRLRPLGGAVVAAGSAAVGVVLALSSWHRPSDMLGSDLIVLGWTALVVGVLTARGRVRRAPRRGRRGRLAMAVLVALVAVAAAVAVLLAVRYELRLRDQAAHAVDPEAVLSAALPGGLAAVAAGGLLASLGLLWLLAGLDFVGGRRAEQE